MDSAGMVMMCEVLIGPLFQDKGGALMVWDNCGPSKVAAVREVFYAWNIRCMELPERMTGHLQVMDLVVNGPLKAAIRRSRTRELYDFFQAWKISRLKALAENKPLPPFKPPKAKLVDGLNALFLSCS